jgi:hypothetical protein
VTVKINTSVAAQQRQLATLCSQVCTAIDYTEDRSKGIFDGEWQFVLIWRHFLKYNRWVEDQAEWLEVSKQFVYSIC